MSIAKWTGVTIAGLIGAILKAKPESFPQDIGEILTWIQNNAWWILVTTAVATAFPRVIQHFLGPPWVWESIQKVLNLSRRRALKKKHEKDDVHDHRVTLFKHCRVWSTLCCVRRDKTGRRRWPWSGWLVPIVRSGHTTQKTRTIFLAPDDADNAEGIAGKAWTSQNVVKKDQLPLVEEGASEADIKDYADGTFCTVEWVKAKLRDQRPLSRTLIAFPVEVDGRCWGVVVLDSKSPTEVDTPDREVELLQLTLAELIKRC